MAAGRVLDDSTVKGMTDSGADEKKETCIWGYSFSLESLFHSVFSVDFGPVNNPPCVSFLTLENGII